MKHTTNLQRPRAAFQHHHIYRPLPTSSLPLPQPLPPLTTPPPSKVFTSTPLTSRLLSIPPQIQTYCSNHSLPYQPYNFSYHNQFFWFSISSVLFVWRYPYILNWGSTSPLPQLILTINFNQPVSFTKMGKIRGYQYDSYQLFEVLAVALPNKIMFFTFNEKMSIFESMNMEVSTNTEIVHDMVFKGGNVFYVGDQGTLKIVFNKPRFFRKQTHLKSVSSSLLSDTIRNSILFWKVNIISSSLTIIDDLAYVLIHKKYPNSWFAKRIIYNKVVTQEYSIRVFDIKTNTLIREIDEHILIDKIKFKADKKVDFVRKINIVGLFEREGRLGVAFSCGMFAYLGEGGLVVEDVKMVPLVRTHNVVGEKIDREYDVNAMIGSLGFENLSYFYNAGVGYFDESGYYPGYGVKGKEVLGVVEMKGEKGREKERERGGGMFEEQRQWVCLSEDGGVYQMKKLRLQDILLVYIYALSSEGRDIKSFANMFEPFNHLCLAYGTTEVCAHIMQLICSDNLEIEIEEQAYQNTCNQFYKPHQFSSPHPLPPSPLLLNRKIRTNENIIQLAAEILNHLSTQQSSLRPTSASPDILWKSILYYFNSIYDLVKRRTPSWCRSNFELVEFVQEKLECFGKLLKIKQLEFRGVYGKGEEADRTLSLNGDEESEGIPPYDPCLRLRYDANTPILLTRSQLLISKILTLLSTSLLLQPQVTPQQPTIHQILLDKNTRNTIRSRIFNDIDPSSPIMKLLIKNFPDLFNYNDQVFNQFILNPKNKTRYFSVEDIAPALKTERVPIVKEYYYKGGRIYDFVVLMGERMKYLQAEKERMKRERERERVLVEEGEDWERKAKELEGNWVVIVNSFEEGMRDYVASIKKKQVENKLQQLADYVKSIGIPPVTEFMKNVLIQQGLNFIVKEISESKPTIDIRPKSLIQWKL